MHFSSNFIRAGACVGLFSTGALAGVVADRKGLTVSLSFAPLANKTKNEKLITNYEDKDLRRFIRATEILKYGFPASLVPPTLYYENHVLEFDPHRRTPKWVAEHITKDHVEPPSEVQANRKHSRFTPDPNLPRDVSSNNDDFWNSGWSRGHLAPAGNNKHSQQAMNDTFYLSNIVPQDLDNNGDFWNRLEIYCRDLTKRFSDVRIISGPLWRPLEAEEAAAVPSAIGNSGDQVMFNGQKRKPHKIMHYPVIGENQVSVPTHLFKIVLVEDPSLSSPLLAAFVVPNKPIPRNFSLKDFKVELEEIETIIGIRFHDGLDRSSTADLCEVEGCTMMDYRTFQTFFVKRGILGARTMNELNRYWKKAVNLELVSPELTDVRNEAIQRISEAEKMKQESLTQPQQSEPTSGA